MENLRRVIDNQLYCFKTSFLCHKLLHCFDTKHNKGTSPSILESIRAYRRFSRRCFFFFLFFLLLFSPQNVSKSMTTWQWIYLLCFLSVPSLRMSLFIWLIVLFLICFNLYDVITLWAPTVLRVVVINLLCHNFIKINTEVTMLNRRSMLRTFYWFKNSLIFKMEVLF